MSCVAPGCKTGYGTRGTYPPGVGAHHIPKNPELRQKWMEAIPRANWAPTKHSRICSLHFDENDYLTERMDTNPHRRKGPLKVRRLKPDAVPHIFHGLPPMIFVKKEGTKIVDGQEVPITTEGRSVTRSVGKDRARIKVSQVESSWKKKGKQLKDGEFDLNSVMPWKLDFNTNDKEATFWLWEQKWRTFYNFIGLHGHDEEYKLSTLKSYLSQNVLQLIDSFNLPPYQANDVEYILTALRIHAAKQSSVVNARMNFNLRVQEDHEVFDTFLVDLLVMAKSCEFCEGCRDNLIRDRIIIGLNDNETINKLLKRPELSLQQSIIMCRAEEKRKLFPDQVPDPFFDGEGFHFKTEPDVNIPRGRKRKAQHADFRPESGLSDIDDHTYSATTPKVYFEEIETTTSFNADDDSEVDTTVVSVDGNQVIITMEDGSSIQNVLDLGEFNDDLVNLHGGPITIKTEIIENVDMTPTDENEMPQAEENEMASMTDTTMTSMQESMQEPTEEPSKSAGAKETTQGKRRQFKPKQTFDEYLAQLGLENFGVKEKFLCHMCPQEFNTSTRMLHHIKNVHEREHETPKKVTGGKCKFCNEEFTLMKHLKKHISEVHKDYKPFECKMCPAKFYQAGHLRRHIRILHENERRFACDLCPRRFGERDGLLNHKRNVHEEQKCGHCNEIFANGKELRIHISGIHPQDKPHLCDSCGKSFGNQAILTNHVLRVHEGATTLKAHECQACGARFTHYHFLLYHIKKLQKRECAVHMKLGDSNEFNLPDFEIATLRREVKKLHYEEDPPKCKLCNFTFTAVPTLRSHMATVHGKEKNFECGVCQKRFKTSKILMQHTQSIHLGMKPYDCPHCPSKFGQLAHKVRHVKVVHQGLKEFVCDSCGKKYANKIDLNNHLKKVHDQGFTFNCPHCGNKYEKKRDLLNHLEEVHEPEVMAEMN